MVLLDVIVDTSVAFVDSVIVIILDILDDDEVANAKESKCVSMYLL